MSMIQMKHSYNSQRSILMESIARFKWSEKEEYNAEVVIQLEANARKR